jgi:hypothetical protein
MIVNLPELLLNPKLVLQQTLADENSRFLNNLDSTDESSENVRLWAVRLMYLAIHYHQHAPALKEAQHRLKLPSSACSAEMEKRQIGKFDFECPGAKYLVISLQSNGLGANIRDVIFGFLTTGLLTGRIVHFITADCTGRWGFGA